MLCMLYAFTTLLLLRPRRVLPAPGSPFEEAAASFFCRVRRLAPPPPAVDEHRASGISTGKKTLYPYTLS
jgi:hypothetical protein